MSNVYSGYIYSENKSSLEAGIECDGGVICIKFNGNGRSALTFCHALMMSQRRKDGVMTSPLPHKELLDSDNILGTMKGSLLPLISDEKVINTISGSTDNVYVDCGSGFFAKTCNRLRCFFGCGCCWTKNVDNCCSKESCNDECCCSGQRFTPFFFPCLPYILTCGLMPFLYRSTVIVTNMSVFRVASVSNHGFCGFLRHLGICKQGPFAKTDTFTISWELIDSLSGFNVDIDGAGMENVVTRLCRNNCCGRVLCPIGVATADVKLDFKGNYSYSTIKIEPNYAWVKDESLNKSIKFLTQLQTTLHNDANGNASSIKSSPVIAKASRIPTAPPAPPVVEVMINRDLELGDHFYGNKVLEDEWSSNKLNA